MSLTVESKYPHLIQSGDLVHQTATEVVVTIQLDRVETSGKATLRCVTLQALAARGITPHLFPQQASVRIVDGNQFVLSKRPNQSGVCPRQIPFVGEPVNAIIVLDDEARFQATFRRRHRVGELHLKVFYPHGTIGKCPVADCFESHRVRRIWDGKPT